MKLNGVRFALALAWESFSVEIVNHHQAFPCFTRDAGSPTHFKSVPKLVCLITILVSSQPEDLGVTQAFRVTSIFKNKNSNKNGG